MFAYVNSCLRIIKVKKVHWVFLFYALKPSEVNRIFFSLFWRHSTDLHFGKSFLINLVSKGSIYFKCTFFMSMKITYKTTVLLLVKLMKWLLLKTERENANIGRFNAFIMDTFLLLCVKSIYKAHSLVELLQQPYHHSI